MAFPVFIAVTSLLLVLYLRSILKWRSRSQGYPLPPGPIRLPLLGNAFNIPHFKPWIGHREVSLQYKSDIIYYRVLGQDIVVLNSAKAITELLDKRSANTSQRPQTPLIEIAGLDWSFLFMPYGPRWRQHRRVFWQYFNPSVTEKYRLAHINTTREFLRRLSDDPDRLKEHVRRTFSATMMKVIYDNEDEDDIERQEVMIEEMQLGVGDCLTPGRYLAQLVPFANRVPEWFLGPQLRRKAPQWRAVCDALRNEPFQKASEAMKKNVGHESIVNAFLSEATSLSSSFPEDEIEVIKSVSTIAFEGEWCGSDTSYSTLQSVFLALSLYPKVVHKAQAELDSVVGPHRLPDFDDRPSLVYVNAIVKEAFRWQNVAPLSVPHGNIADEVIDGYFIPAGSIILSNVWACMHDPEVYPNPDEFRPERFIKDGQLDPAVRDPYAFVFGSGRRICPGRHFADESLFINVASILHVYDISPARDEQGAVIEIKPEMSHGVVSYPEDCRCTIKPRSAAAEVLIMGATS